MTLHLHSCTFTPRSKRSDVRIDEKRKAEMKAALEREVAQDRADEPRTVKRRNQPYYIVR